MTKMVRLWEAVEGESKMSDDEFNEAVVKIDASLDTLGRADLEQIAECVRGRVLAEDEEEDQ